MNMSISVDMKSAYPKAHIFISCCRLVVDWLRQDMMILTSVGCLKATTHV